MPPTPVDDPRPRRRLSGALLIGGGAAVVAGAALAIIGTSKVSGASGDTIGEFASDVSAGRRMQWIGGLLGGAGIIAGALGVWRWQVSSDVAIEPSVTTSSVSIGVMWRR